MIRKYGEVKSTSATRPRALLFPWELTPTISQSIAIASVKLTKTSKGKGDQRTFKQSDTQYGKDTLKFKIYQSYLLPTMIQLK